MIREIGFNPPCRAAQSFRHGHGAPVLFRIGALENFREKLRHGLGLLAGGFRDDEIVLRLHLGARGAHGLRGADDRRGDQHHGDGISNVDEYLAGTFAFDPADGFRLQLVPRPNDTPLLEFTVITARTYTLFSSTNLQTWTPMSFKIPADGPGAVGRENFTATEIRPLQVEPQLPPGGTNANFFYKVQVQ